MNSEEIVFTDEEASILLNIYNNSISTVKILDINKCLLKEKEYQMKVKEFAFHLDKLRSSGYINFTDVKTFSKSGKIDEKYKNNAAAYYPNNDITITHEGREIIEDVEQYFDEENSNDESKNQNVIKEVNNENNISETEVINDNDEVKFKHKVFSFLSSVVKATIVKTSAGVLIHSVTLVMNHFVH